MRRTREGYIYLIYQSALLIRETNDCTRENETRLIYMQTISDVAVYLLFEQLDYKTKKRKEEI